MPDASVRGWHADPDAAAETVRYPELRMPGPRWFVPAGPDGQNAGAAVVCSGGA
jgi:hypothetical protein